MTSPDVVSIAGLPLNVRCLALTGTFETSCPPPGCFGSVTGDFDGQGISYSALQWNFGQGTLQPLLLDMSNRHPELVRSVFGEGYDVLTKVLAATRSTQMSWARSIQTSRHTLQEPWTGRFHALGQTAEFQAVATARAAALFDGALALCRTLGLTSQRAAALLFDIKVQNGGIGSAALAQLDRDFSSLPIGEPAGVETAKLRKLANRIADAANPKWREDVRARKLTVANGAGVVHGVHFDLATQFGLTLSSWSAD